MKDSNEQRIQNQFGGFCTRVLKNEVRCIRREYARRREQEKPLGELEQTATWDRYFMDEHVFEVQGLPVVVTGNLLAEAVSYTTRKGVSKCRLSLLYISSDIP